jgi:hypothetical protein
MRRRGRGWVRGREVFGRYKITGLGFRTAVMSSGRTVVVA